MHTTEVLTRNDFWEVYTEMDAANLQSTFEMCTIRRMPHIESTYDCGRFVPTNGVNFIGSPGDFPFTPKEGWQAARKQSLLSL